MANFGLVGLGSIICHCGERVVGYSAEMWNREQGQLREGLAHCSGPMSQRTWMLGVDFVTCKSNAHC